MYKFSCPNTYLFHENVFQQKLKNYAAFVDLTAAYETVWQASLLVKLSESLPPWVAETVQFMLQNRMFWVHNGDKVSEWSIQKKTCRPTSNGFQFC